MTTNDELEQMINELEERVRILEATVESFEFNHPELF